MTTETESIEALHLWLATELRELRLPAEEWDGVPAEYPDAAVSRGWTPNVTTDALLEALRPLGWVTHFTTYQTLPQIICYLTDSLELWAKEVSADGDTPHEALCRAARKALEAAS